MDDLQMMQYLNTKVHNWGVKWTAEEDQRLLRGIELYGEQNWKSVSEMVGTRTSVKCVQRWEKVLRPDLVKGKWTEEEDNALKEIVLKGFEHWGKVAEQMTGRTSKQCRERWANYLDPSLIKTPFSPAEDETVLRLQSEFGNKWAYIARLMPGRTENSVKLRYHSLVKTYGGRNGVNFRKTMNMMMLANEALPPYQDTSDDNLHPAKKPHLMKPQQQQQPAFADDLVVKQSLLNPSFVLNNNTSNNTTGLEQQMLFLHHQQQQQHMQHIQQLQMQHLNQHRNLLSPAALQMQQQQLLLKQQQNSHLNQMHFQQLQQQMLLQKQQQEMYPGILPPHVLPSGHQPYFHMPPAGYIPQQQNQQLFYPFSNQNHPILSHQQQILSQMKDNINPNQELSIGHSIPHYNQLSYPMLQSAGQSSYFQQESTMVPQEQKIESSTSKQQQSQHHSQQHLQQSMVGFKNYTMQDIDNFIKHTTIQKTESADSLDSEKSGKAKNK